jgi:hypothetical protein
MFDGRDYLGADLIYPFAYHPRAPLTAKAVAGALRAHYFTGRRHGQELWGIHTRSNMRRPEYQRDNGEVLSAVTWTGIGSGYHYLPIQATHLCARIWFRWMNLSPDLLAYFRIFVGLDATTAADDTGATVEATGPGSWSPDGRVVAERAETSELWSPFAEDLRGAAVVDVEVAVSVASIRRGSICYSSCQAYTTSTLRGIISPISILDIEAWWEARG